LTSTATGTYEIPNSTTTSVQLGGIYDPEFCKSGIERPA
jgi:hypothetical protein